MPAGVKVFLCAPGMGFKCGEAAFVLHKTQKTFK
jgi:hypothetical protein